MCGIVAILEHAGHPLDPALLRRMGDRLAHRGPDGEGQLIEGQVGLHHKRLAVLDPERGQQPMTRGPFTVVFNGAIYNYRELRQQLQSEGYTFETTSDTEVLLQLYAARGLDAIKQFHGMFAFVLLDRAARRLVAARDHFGIKPLYVARDGARVLLASEIKALLAHPAVPARVDREGLEQYLTFQFTLGTRTLFEGIEKLTPGCYCVWSLDSGAPQTTRYWQPDFTVDLHHTDAYFVDQLRALLESAVSWQLRSDVPLGSYLSGGIDSSLVTTLAARGRAERLKCFTGAFREGPAFDETYYARLVAREVGAQLHITYPSGREFCELLPRLVYLMDEPAAGPGLYPQYMLSRLAAQHVKVVLGGQGGDEMFAGYARYLVAYLEQALKGAIYETNDEGEHIVSLVSVLPNLPNLKQYTPMLQRLWSSGLFQDMDARYFALIDRSAGNAALLSPAARRELNPARVFETFRQHFHRPDTASYYNKMTAFDMGSSLPALLHVEDRVSMAASIEARVPLLDRRIVDLVATAPPAMKFRGGEPKHLLKRAIRDLLPPEVLGRKDKMGFPVPLQAWSRGVAREFLRDTLLSRASRERGLFDCAELERLLDEEGAFGRQLWGAVNLELWHQKFIDAPAG